MSRSPRTHAIAALAGLAACTLAWLALFRADFDRPTPSSSWIDALYEAKERALASTRPPRVVLVGGSGVLFALRADMLSARWGVPVVNFGTHAGLDLAYLLHRVERVVAPGDTVLLSIEYELYGRDPGVIGPVLLDYLLARDVGYLTSRPLLQQARAAFSLEWDRAWLPFKETVPSPAGAAVYRIGSVTALGDILGNDRAAQSTVYRGGLLQEPGIALAWREDNLAILDAFLARCRARGIRVVATAPALMDRSDYARADHGEAWRRLVAWHAERGVEWIVQPREALYPPPDFLDTHYHLVSDVAAANSARVAQRWTPLAASPR